VVGRKRHVLVDSTGLLLAVLVTSAKVSDLAGAKALLKGGKKRFPALRLVWADSAYAGLVAWAKRFWGWAVEVKKRPPGATGFVVIPRRWVVERTFGWVSQYRRLWRDGEALTPVSETMVKVAMLHLMARRVLPAKE
jgi:putative transposase